jgi:hypothetical protein
MFTERPCPHVRSAVGDRKPDNKELESWMNGELTHAPKVVTKQGHFWSSNGSMEKDIILI